MSSERNGIFLIAWEKLTENISISGAHKAPVLSFIIINPNSPYEDRDSTVVKVLCYKSESSWFDSRWCHWNFSLN